MKTVTYIDKEQQYGPGPWVGEIDRKEWIDPATGLDCLITRNPSLGNLCGYVAVPKGHPLFGFDYSESLFPSDDSASVDSLIQAHGGLTFAAPCDEENSGCPKAVCHIPEPGRPEEVWWFGFDCAHGMDVIPFMQRFHMVFAPMEKSYPDIAYVERECATIARQLMAIGDKLPLERMAVPVSQQAPE